MGDGAPHDQIWGPLKQQQAFALEGPLRAQLQQLEAPADALVALSPGRSQQDLYLLLLALIKKTCSSEAWRAKLGEEGETREQLLLLLQQQLDGLAAAVNEYRTQQQQEEETVSLQPEDNRKNSASSSDSSINSSSINSSSINSSSISSESSSSESSSNSSSNSSSSSSNNNSSSSSNSSSSNTRVIELAGVLCVFVRLLRNLCVKPVFVETLITRGLLSRLVPGSQVVETCSLASRLLSKDSPPAAAAAAATAANEETAADEGMLSAAAAAITAEPAAAAAAAAACGLSPSFFSLPFMCAETLMLPQSLLQLLGNAAAAAAAAPVAAPAAAVVSGVSRGIDGDREETRSQIWNSVGRLQLLELALCSSAPAPAAAAVAVGAAAAAAHAAGAASCDSAFAFLHLLFGCKDTAATKLTEEPLLEGTLLIKCVRVSLLRLLQLQAALFTVAAQEAACVTAEKTGGIQGGWGAHSGGPQGECGEWACIFCCSLLTRLQGLPFVALLEFIQQ
ncbi:hypothetical protein ACSSS7_007238 [Eimeria intestinalis]